MIGAWTWVYSYLVCMGHIVSIFHHIHIHMHWFDYCTLIWWVINIDLHVAAKDVGSLAMSYVSLLDSFLPSETWAWNVFKGCLERHKFFFLASKGWALEGVRSIILCWCTGWYCQDDGVILLPFGYAII